LHLLAKYFDLYFLGIYAIACQIFPYNKNISAIAKIPACLPVEGGMGNKDSLT